MAYVEKDATEAVQSSYSLWFHSFPGFKGRLQMLAALHISVQNLAPVGDDSSALRCTLDE